MNSLSSKALRGCSAFVLAASLAPFAGAQTTWYVDVNGTPPGSGAISDPYTSIQHAIDQPTTVNKDTLIVAPGTYVENVQLGTKQLRLIGAGAELCTIQAAGPGDVVDFTYGLELRGFTITGGDAASYALRMTSIDHAVIERCVIAGNAGRGIHFFATGGLGRLFNCTITNNGGEGLFMTHASGGKVRNNIVWGNGLPSSYGFAPHGIGDFFNNDLEDFPFKNTCVSYTCGNFRANPMFADVPNGDYRLQPGSPCLDAGYPGSLPDPDGSVADVGAYPFDLSLGPIVYCKGQVNSQSCTPAVGFTGTPSAAGAPFDITCSSVVNNEQGLLFYGHQSKATPYQGGTLCVRAPLERTPLQSSGGNPPPDDCSGQYAFDFGAEIQSGSNPNLVAGATVYAQFWYHDPQLPGPFATGRSDAIAFEILP
jgi:parallel beta-helix repeat protein